MSPAKESRGLATLPVSKPPPSNTANTQPTPYKLFFGSRTCEWPTPKWLFDALDREFRFTLDPCSTHQNAKCKEHFTIEDDGLLQSWRNQVVFMNPPYGRAIAKWMEKAYNERDHGATVVCLVPARTDTAWWHNWAMKGEIRFLRGRVKFEGAISVAPFPSAVVVFRPAAFALVTYVPDRRVAIRSAIRSAFPDDPTAL